MLFYVNQDFAIALFSYLGSSHFADATETFILCKGLTALNRLFYEAIIGLIL